MYYGVLVSGSRFHGKSSLTYSSDEKLLAGQLVEVPLQKRKTLGIVVGLVTKPELKVKEIARVLPFVLPTPMLKLLNWLQDYYPAPLGSLVELFVPSGPIPAKLKANLLLKPVAPDLSKLPKLTQDQEHGLSQLNKQDSGSSLLHGNTGTGKTRLYIEKAADNINKGRSVIILTPEIGLTQPLASQFIEVFGKNRVVITHSGLSTAQRREIWQEMIVSDQPLIVIGPRSALFSPLQNVGLIVIDEAHDAAYKQEQSPHYLALRVAAQLARLYKAQLILGSATPSVADYWQFKSKDLPIIRLIKPAIKSEFKTTKQLVDLRDNSLFTRSNMLSTPLLNSVEAALKNKKQSLLFLNRRGSARVILCRVCGWQAMCPRCDSSLIYHDDTYEMQCHSCGFKAKVPTSCPNCQASEIIFRVPGTKALEAELSRLFPQALIGRFDSDSRGGERLHQRFDELKSGDLDIVIGTQTVTKGFDLPKLSVIGVVQADSGLQLPDFTSTERTYQLLSQVSGRIGRGHGEGKIFIQSYKPDQPLIKWAISQDYEAFYDHEIAQRQQFGFPPFNHLLKIQALRASSTSAQEALVTLAERLNNVPSLDVIGPSPSFLARQNGKYSWQLVVRSPKRTILLQLIQQLSSNLRYDLDPADLL